ncbi:Peroxisomal carnitine O-octanoyltransferase (COT) [Durusdinium trenchii]|uniref:Peroxisomal carnitine O-octanoyltransferase (COT) n=1 Tax=Durusdinium trenchii TaxID=1381693 RepID=A0ABP0MHK5_9DINO
MSGAGTPALTTFGAQATLPTLPVPKLDESLAEFVSTVECLLSEEEFEEIKRLVADFGKKGGDGEKLQELLEAKAAGLKGLEGPAVVTNGDHPDGSAYPNSHWLENWWETYAYLGDRTSLAVNINCFQTHFKARPTSKVLERGAWLVKASVDARRLLNEGLVPPERAGKSVFCSAQYCRVFSTTRVPGAEVDKLFSYTKSTHIAVERRGHWYAVFDVTELSVAALQKQLQFIVDDAATRPRGPGVAAFTADERSRWADARGRIQALSPSNAKSLEAIESAIFHLVLSEESPKDHIEVHQLGQTGNGHQIWFDKSQTHLLFENGCLTTNLEHTSADAVVPARIYAYTDEYIQINAPAGVGYDPDCFFKEGTSGIPVTRDSRVDDDQHAVVLIPPQRLDITLDSGLERSLEVAKSHVGGIIDDNIVTCLTFEDFGAATIAKNCKGISTDSFAQMSLALAYHRDQGEIAVPYETATTRSFFHGRTETIRPQSMAMKAMCEAFAQRDQVSDADIAKLVRAAGNHHRNYLRRCMAGKGIDRHLMGLRILSAEQGMPMHPMFQHKAYTKSTTFTLSTSQMPFAIEDWPGFGAYDPSAYAVCYRFTGANTIVATVASRKHTGNGKDAVRFCAQIKTAFRDLHDLLAANPPPPKPKL